MVWLSRIRMISGSLIEAPEVAVVSLLWEEPGVLQEDEAGAGLKDPSSF